jgi:hypothetical protein
MCVLGDGSEVFTVVDADTGEVVHALDVLISVPQVEQGGR